MKELTTPKEKGARLQSLRKLARFSQNEMAKMIGISESGYKGWENGRHGGLPERRAHLLVDIFTREGIVATSEWLMYGIGCEPQKTQGLMVSDNVDLVSDTVQKSLRSDAEIIEHELNCFRHNNLNTLDLKIADNAMSPFYETGDVVAGIKLSKKQFAKAINMTCIVQTLEGVVLLRQLQTAAAAGCFTLLSINPGTDQARILHDVELISVAPILWHRKPKRL